MSMSFLGPLNPEKLIGDITGSNQAATGAQNAADAQIAASQNANALQKYMYDTTRGDLAPYRQAGTNALGTMQALNGGDMSAFHADPGYQFALNQGLQGIQRQMAAAGLTGSGAALKAANDYSQGMANQQYSNFYNRLAALAGTGQTATDTTGQLGANYANQAGQNLIGAGNAQGSAYIAKGNIGANNFNNLMKIGGQAAAAFGG